MNPLAAPEVWGPDEQVYTAQAQTIRNHGIVRGFRVLSDRFLSEGAEQFPSPLRWLWILISAFAVHFGRRTASLASWALIPVAAWWAFGQWQAALLAVTSPLAFILGKRALQDTTVALFAIVALGFALSGNAVGLAVAVFALLSIKEATVFYVPALVTVALYQGCGFDIAAVPIAMAAWLAVTRFIVGRDTWSVFSALRDAHGSDYTKAYQRGAPHRLAVDLFLVSPLVTVAAFYSGNVAVSVFALLTIAAHAVSPIRNVRTVLAVDVALRFLAATVLPVWGVVVLSLVDLLVARQLRGVYDPTTSALTGALRMS